MSLNEKKKLKMASGEDFYLLFLMALLDMVSIYLSSFTNAKKTHLKHYNHN